MSERVADAIAELYAVDPASFTGRRKALADEARNAGDKDAAKQITALRKPTRAAWVVNQLARSDPGAPGRLTGLAAELRDATLAKDGRRLRELSARRGPLIDALAVQALDAAGITDPPTALRAEVTETLTSALADPGTARDFAAGTLIRAAQWSGFEGAPASEFPASFSAPEGGPREGLGDAAGVRRGRRRSVPLAAAGGLGGCVSPPSAGFEKGAKPPLGNRADAERIVAAATDAAAAAGAREDELEAEVRDLEEQLTRARAELADARVRARRAESAERKARQRLDRLDPPRLSSQKLLPQRQLLRT